MGELLNLHFHFARSIMHTNAARPFSLNLREYGLITRYREFSQFVSCQIYVYLHHVQQNGRFNTWRLSYVTNVIFKPQTIVGGKVCGEWNEKSWQKSHSHYSRFVVPLKISVGT